MTSSQLAPTPMDALSLLLDKGALAQRMGVSRRKLEQYVAEGDVPPGVRIGSTLKWEARVADEWRQRVFQTQRDWRPRALDTGRG